MKSRTAELRARLVQLIAELPDSNSEETDSDDCPSQVLTYGSFFSGMECPLTALEIVANTSRINRVLKPQFACDINKHCRDVLSKHFRHGKLLSDITRCNIKKDFETVDIFWSSAPCQDFSCNGKRKGGATSRGRLFRFHCRYINHHQPNAWVLEQVPAFKQDKKYAREYRAQMRQLKHTKLYHIEEHILDTENFGVPQRRKRLYIIGVNICKMVRQPKFAAPQEQILPALRLEDLIDRTMGTDKDIPTSSVPLSNLIDGLQRAQRRFNVNPLDRLVVMDLFGSRVNMSLNRSPTITATRASRRGYWLSSKKRFTNVDELMRLQGIPSRRYAWNDTVTPRQIGHMIGSGVSCNVAISLMTKILSATIL